MHVAAVHGHPPRRVAQAGLACKLKCVGPNHYPENGAAVHIVHDAVQIGL
jgi:hypothetical protein